MASSQNSSSITTISSACHCGKLTASVDVPTQELPLHVWLCSCTTCRKSSGSLAVTCALLPHSYSNFKANGPEIRYATSSGPQALIRCFCPTCGAFVYEDSHDKSKKELFTGALTKVEEGLLKVEGIIYNGDCGDGGLAVWLPGVKTWEGNRKANGDYQCKELPPTTTTDEKLACRCHCGGVDFEITRPNEESTKLKCHLNDSFYPELKNTGAGENMLDNPDDIKWWVRGEGKKYAALLCACNACRLCTGFDIQPWAYVPLANMVWKGGKPLEFDMGTLKEYNSSKGVLRHFCGTCGANVFFREDNRPLLIDFSLGIAEPLSGSRGEEWFEYAPEVSYPEYAQHKELIDILTKGVKKWSGRNGGEAGK